jgi:uncharacterized membrane protein YccC
LPTWLTHALTWPRGPVPWGAVARAALGAAVLPAGLVSGRSPGIGVLAALGAMLATVNDRPGGRRAAVPRIGVPAFAGATGLTVGTALQVSHTGKPLTTLVLTAVGLLAGMISALGPVASAAGTQLLITTAIGAGMPSRLPLWDPAVVFLVGAAWVLTLRLVLPVGRLGGMSFLGGEREAVATAYLAVADLLEAVGTPAAPDRRSALSAALDRAQEALGGPRLRAAGESERRLHAQFAAVLPLAEAAAALAWDGTPVPNRLVTAPRQLAQAVRDGSPCGPLAAPNRQTAALRALDDAVLAAAHTFGSSDSKGGSRLSSSLRPVVRLRRATAHAVSAAGREYGLRVAFGTVASTAVAMTLHPRHWYWMPVTAAFLIKPDLGPLVSRVLSRAAGTVAGALLFVAWSVLLPGTFGAVAAVVLAAAFIPVAARHFAGLTAAVTMLVLALIGVGSGPQAVGDRITDTLLACALVLAVGHLPIPGHSGRTLAARVSAAAEAANRYEAGLRADAARRAVLRRAAYRTLADARAAVELSGAEHPSLARHGVGAASVVAELERLVDATTAYAVRASQGEPLPPEVTALHTRLHDMAAAR